VNAPHVAAHTPGPDLLAEVAALREQLSEVAQERDRLLEHLRALRDDPTTMLTSNESREWDCTREHDALRAEVSRLRDAISEALAFRNTPASYDKLRAALAEVAP
jgi:uncharacterized coiled-coil DUF342 family protein